MNEKNDERNDVKIEVVVALKLNDKNIGSVHSLAETNLSIIRAIADDLDSPLETFVKHLYYQCLDSAFKRTEKYIDENGKVFLSVVGEKKEN